MITALLSGVAVSASSLLPFAHPNLLSRLSVFFTNPLEASVFLAALAGGHVVFSLFPSLFLFFPSEQNALSGAFRLANPSSAVSSSVKAFSFAVLFSLAFSPIAFGFFPALMHSARPFVGALLAAAVLVFLLREKTLASLSASLFVFSLAGVLGFASLAFPIAREPLLPLLSGLFGFPAVIALFLRVPEKETAAARIEAKPAHLVAGSLLGAFSGFLPAMTPAVLSSFAFFFFEADASAFLALNAAIVASKNFFDFANAFAIGKARSGASAGVLELVRETGIDEGIAAPQVLLATAAATLVACAVLLAALPRLLAFFNSVRIKKLSVFLALAVLAVILAESGLAGIAIAVSATLVGLLPRLLGLRQACATGALIAPALAHYAGISEALTTLLA